MRKKALLYLDPNRRAEQLAFILERTSDALQMGDQVWASITEDQVQVFADQGIYAQFYDDADLIVLPAVSFRPPGEVPEPPADLAAATTGETYYIVQFGAPTDGAWIDAISALGGVYVADVPTFAAVIRLDAARATQVQALPFVGWVGPYHPAYALDFHLAGRDKPFDAADFRNLQVDPAQIVVRGSATLDVFFFGDVGLDDAAQAVTAAGATVVQNTGYSLTINIDSGRVRDILRVSGIQTVEPHTSLGFTNERSRIIIGANQVQNLVSQDFLVNLDGSGEIIGVIDSGLDGGVASPIHPDFAGRVLLLGNINDPAAGPPITRQDFDSHGTHTTGSAAGDGSMAAAVVNPAPNRSIPRGIAPRAQIVFHSNNRAIASFATYAAYKKDNTKPQPFSFTQFLRGLDNAHSAGARVHSNSYGAPGNGTYVQGSGVVDRFAFLRPNSLVLFSAGNYEGDPNNRGVFNMSNLGTEKVSKNILCIGACENVTNKDGYSDSYRSAFPKLFDHSAFDAVAGSGAKGAYPLSDKADDIALFSNRGRVAVSNRVRPDLVAPGTNVISTLPIGFPSDLIQDYQKPNTAPRAGYFIDQGSSMAVPLAAGAAVLARQFYRARFGQLRRPVLIDQLTQFTDLSAVAPHRDGCVIAWARPNAAGDQIEAARYNLDLVRQGNVIQLQTGAGLGPAITIARTGDNTVLLHRPPDGNLRLTLYDAQLNLVAAFGTAGAVTLNPASRGELDRRPSMCVHNNEIAVVWIQNGTNNLLFQRFQANNGNPLDAAPVNVGAATFTSSNPYVIHNGTNYVVVFGQQAGANFQVQLRQVTDAGAAIGAAPVVLATAAAQIRHPHFCWDSGQNRFAVVYVDTTSHPGGDVFLLIANPDGTVAVAPTAIVTAAASSTARQPLVMPHPVSGFVLIWEDSSLQNAQSVYLAFLQPTGALDTTRITEAGNRLRISDTPKDTNGFAASIIGDRAFVVWQSNDEINSDALGVFALSVNPRGTFQSLTDPNTPLLDSGRYVPNQLQEHAGTALTGVAIIWSGGNTFLLRAEPAAAARTADLFLIRTNSDGVPDAAFGARGARRIDTGPGYERVALLWAETRIIAAATQGTQARLFLFDHDGVAVNTFGAAGVVNLGITSAATISPQLGFHPLVAPAVQVIAAFGVAGRTARIDYRVYDDHGHQVGATSTLSPVNTAVGTARHGWFHWIEGESHSIAVWHEPSGAQNVLRINRFNLAGNQENAIGLVPTGGDSQNGVLAPRPVNFQPVFVPVAGVGVIASRQREYGLAWQNRSAAGARWQIRFSQLDRTGAVQAAPGTTHDVTVISSPTDHATDPQLVWHTNGYGLAWLQQPATGGNHTLFFTCLDPQGAAIIPAQHQVSNPGVDVQRFCLVWNGRSFRISWTEMSAGRLRQMQTAIAVPEPGSTGSFDHPFQQPSSALLRATLINGATNIRRTALPNVPSAVAGPAFNPNDGYGWGRVNLRQSLAPAPPVTFQVRDDNSVARNTTNKVQYRFTLPPDTKLLRVSLVWTDPPGNALVNILSLRVQAPAFPAGGNRDFVGNRWQAAPNAQFSASVGAVPPPGGFETTHNVQQVVIPNPPAGEYLVEVRGGAFTNSQYQTFPGQPFALVFVGSGPEWGITLPLTGPLPFY